LGDRIPRLDLQGTLVGSTRIGDPAELGVRMAQPIPGCHIARRQLRDLPIQLDRPLPITLECRLLGRLRQSSQEPAFVTTLVHQR